MNIRKSEINEVLENMNSGKIYTKENSAYQFVSRDNNTCMFRFDLNTGKYKWYYNKEQFARAIVRFWKRGW